MTTLCFFRFWIGFGIGGDYPLSATIMSEYTSKKTRDAFIAAVFPAPAYAIDPAASRPPQADFVWRIILMLGALPAALTYYWRTKMLETARYTALVAKNAKQAAADMSKVLQVEIEELAAQDNSNSSSRASRPGCGPPRVPRGIGVRNSLFLLAGCNLLGLAFTLLVPESKGKSLEEMSGENDEAAAATAATASYNCTVPV
uniref:H(+)/Pi cotransporter n=1 Tax=Saccharum hybrid cultivar R570 TaxID=131158 RepID=A0A059PZB1_9POAL|nr:hypothetical protein SHCRBa_004_O05_F_250 [Saccharum hybrid cultivar R570]